MSKIRKVLDEFLNSIKDKDFRDNKDSLSSKTKSKPAESRAEETKKDFTENKELSKDDPHRSFWVNRSKDPYQDEVDKINQRINGAKALTKDDMRAIENSLAQQDIQKDIHRQEMSMASTEAMARQAAWTKAQEDREKERKRTLREKYLGKNNDQDHDRER